MQGHLRTVTEDYVCTVRVILGVYVCYIYVKGQDRVYNGMPGNPGSARKGKKKAFCGLPDHTEETRK